jgi:hypothetical protein
MKNKKTPLIILLFLCLNISACSTTHYRSNDLDNSYFSPIRKTNSNKKLVKNIISQLEKNHKIENNFKNIEENNKIEEKSLSNIISVLGKPDILRQENKAKIATYKSKECTINIFTYKSGNKYITKYAESNSIKPDQKIGFNHCLASIFLSKFN